MTKRCPRGEACIHPDGPILSTAEYHRSKCTKDGLDSKCKKCASALKKQYYLDNTERLLAIRNEWKKNNKDKIKQTNKAYAINNEEKIKLGLKKYREENKEKRRAYNKQWEQDNQGKARAKVVRRRTQKMNALPLWANLGAIKEVYMDCESVNIAAKLAGCTEKFVVDHIIPLQGKIVSGLHIETNLQIITAKENGTKSNKFEPIKGAV